MVAHERNPFVGADAFRGAAREINRAQAVRPAIDKVAEKDDRALLAALRLPRGFIDEGGQQVGAPVNVADGENLPVRAGGERQREFPALDGCGHGTGDLARKGFGR